VLQFYFVQRMGDSVPILFPFGLFRWMLLILGWSNGILTPPLNDRASSRVNQMEVSRDALFAIVVVLVLVLSFL